MENKEKLAEQSISQKGEYVSFTAGISMRPLLRQGRDIVKVVAIKRPLKKYDVALYRAKEGKLVLHRIIKFDGDYCIFRGDNLISIERIHKDRVFGILAGIYRNKKHYINCENPSVFYRSYVFFNHYSFPIRKFWRKKVSRNITKLKKKIKKILAG